MLQNNPVLDLSKDGLHLLGLGGQQQHIGGNSYLLEWRHKGKSIDSIIIDAGRFLADRRRTGYDSFCQDMRSYFRLRKDALLTSPISPQKPAKALLLTHGHDDHIGNIPMWMHQGYEIPTIYCTALVQGDLLKMCKEASVPAERIDELQFEIIQPHQWLQIGSLQVWPFIKVSDDIPEITHSYAESLAYYIEAPDGSNYVHTGDYKLDPTTPLTQRTGFQALKTEILKPICLVGGDSTNALNDHVPIREADAKEFLLKLVQDNPTKRIVSVVMSRNHQRLATVCDVAALTGRTIEVTGAAIQTSSRVLKATRNPAYDLKKRASNRFFNSAGTKTVSRLYFDNPGKVLGLATGTQGEVLANLARAAYELIDDRLKLNPKKDIVVVSGTLIPGNEEALMKPLERLLKRGFRVITSLQVYGKDLSDKVKTLIDAGLEIDPSAHSSGHANKGDIEKLYGALEPNCVLPIHGSYEQRAANSTIARNMGLKTIWADNAQWIRIFPPAKDGRIKKPELAGATKRFAWFGVNNIGSLGSPHFVFSDTLTDTHGQPMPADPNIQARHQLSFTLTSDEIIRPGAILQIQKDWKRKRPERSGPSSRKPGVRAAAA